MSEYFETLCIKGLTMNILTESAIHVSKKDVRKYFADFLESCV